MEAQGRAPMDEHEEQQVRQVEMLAEVEAEQDVGFDLHGWGDEEEREKREMIRLITHRNTVIFDLLTF